MPPVQEADQLAEFLSRQNEGEKYRDLPLEESLPILRSLHPEEYGLVHSCLAMRLSVDDYEHRSLGEFEKWLDAVRIRGDVIITTNYDTLIEQAHASMPPAEIRDCLHCLDFGVRAQRAHRFSYANRWDRAPELSVLLLKLHGSVSWLFCQTCHTYALDPIWGYAPDSTARPGVYPPCPECRQIGARRPVLVSPLKQMDLTDPAIREIWQVAERTLGEAEEIVFAGFSLNENDENVTSLVKTAFNQGVTKRVIVVDPSPDARKNYARVYGDLVQFAAETDWKSFLDHASYQK
jgi:NAD-dependent SIR2 family protein deacetylase